jgi:hypothetical protein
MKDNVLPETLRKIEALQKSGSTQGEQSAAASALERVKTISRHPKSATGAIGGT